MPIQPTQPVMPEADRPGEQERGFEVEDDEPDRHEVEAHVELAARVLERGKAAFVFAELVGVGLCAPVSRETAIGANTNSDRQPKGDENEEQYRQILAEIEHGRFPSYYIPMRRL